MLKSETELTITYTPHFLPALSYSVLCVTMHLTLFVTHYFILIGKGEEQSLAANLGVLLLIQLGAGDESEEAFKTLQPLLKTTLLDKTAAPKARASVSS